MTVELPPGESKADWARAAELSGATLAASTSAPLARIETTGLRWRVTVLDEQGRSTTFLVSRPSSAHAREDLLNTIVSLAHPAPVADLPALVVPTPKAKPPPAPRRRPRRSAPLPPPAEPVEPRPAAEPLPPPPERGRDPESDLDPDLLARTRRSRPAEADGGPTWAAGLVAGFGVRVRSDATPGAAGLARVVAERGRWGLGAGVEVFSRAHDRAEPSSFSWAEVRPGLGVHRAGPGPVLGAQSQLALRRYASGSSTSAWLATPQLQIEAGWRLALRDRLAMAVCAWASTDLAPTSVITATNQEVAFSLVSAGVRLDVQQMLGPE